MRGPVRAYRPRSPPPPPQQPPQPPQPPVASFSCARPPSSNPPLKPTLQEWRELQQQQQQQQARQRPVVAVVAPEQPPPPRHLPEQEREELRRIFCGSNSNPPDQSAASGPLPERPAPPQPQRPPPRPTQRQIWIPVSDGTFALADGSTTVRRGYTGKISITTDERGTRVVTEEPLDPGFEARMAELERSFTGVKEKKKPVPPPRPPPPKTVPATVNTEEGEWLSTRRRPLTSTPRRPPRWVSPPPQRPRSPPPPYQGIVVTEVPQRPQSPPASVWRSCCREERGCGAR